MFRKQFGAVLWALGMIVSVGCAATAVANGGELARWRVTGIIFGQSFPFTTASYFPRPLSPGEIVKMDFVMKRSPTPVVGGTNVSYEGVIAAATASGAGWRVRLAAPLARGAVAISNDDPDYGDSMIMTAISAASAGSTWYGLEIDMRNPGGPNPGVGPWSPFSSLAMPRSPPSLASFLKAGFVITARRDQPGQELDGAAYFGTIVSISEVDD